MAGQLVQLNWKAFDILSLDLREELKAKTDNLFCPVSGMVYETVNT